MKKLASILSAALLSTSALAETETNYTFRASVKHFYFPGCENLQGTIVGTTNGTYPAGYEFNVQAIPNNEDYSFVCWTGTCFTTLNPFGRQLIRNESLVGCCVPKTTPRGTHYPWFTYWGLTNKDDYADLDNDGADNYNEWVADTNPTNAASCFKFLMRKDKPNKFIIPQTSKNRRYQVFYRMPNAHSDWTLERIIQGTGEDLEIEIDNSKGKLYKVVAGW